MNGNNTAKDCGLTPETTPKLNNPYGKLLKTIKKFKKDGNLLSFVTDDFKNSILFEYKVLLVKKEIGYPNMIGRNLTMLNITMILI